MKLGLFGLGCVGKEVSQLALERGIDVSAVDIDESTISACRNDGLFKNKPGDFLATTNSENIIQDLDAIIIAVPTSLKSGYNIDLDSICSVCHDIAAKLEVNKEPIPIIIESTIPPGTMTKEIIPIFRKHDLIVGEDIHLVHAPERVDPGNENWPLESIPRVVGGVTKEGTEIAASFYSDLIDADVYQANSAKEAACSKIIENAYRDINIAFVNEMARVMDFLGIDIKKVLDAAETKPFGFTRFSPGAGVGGHCIPVDPYFLISEAEKNGHKSRFLKIARETNNEMPSYLADKTIKSIINCGRLPQNSTALLLGKTFKPGIDDTRNSPYFTVRSELESYDMKLETYDPQLPEESTVNTPYFDADAIILLTQHPEFSDLEMGELSKLGVDLFVDGRNVYSPKRIEEAGIEYVGVGRE